MESPQGVATDPALDALPCGVVSFDDTGTIRYANATLARLLGYSPSDLPGRHVETLLTVAGRIFFQTHLFPRNYSSSCAGRMALTLVRSSMRRAVKHRRDP
jgi:PAS domain S-box-containing protein